MKPLSEIIWGDINIDDALDDLLNVNGGDIMATEACLSACCTVDNKGIDDGGCGITFAYGAANAKYCGIG